jgi:Tex-like protein N-terminal domain/Transposase C of IS166 homeodomain/zinc-finger binding domain of transposase IS66
MTSGADRILRTIASKIRARPEQVKVAIGLLDEGATVPFVARYRKEATGGLDDTQLRQLEERLAYLRELEARRVSILDTIRSQGKLTAGLEAKIAIAITKTELEDIYLPFRPKRRTRADMARERGLEPLADAILADRTTTPAELAKAYFSELVPDIKAALDGARDILAETFAENASLVGQLRSYVKTHAMLCSRIIPGKAEAGAKFSDYFDHRERFANTPSHRALAMLRGRNEDILSLEIEIDAESTSALKPVEQMITQARLSSASAHALILAQRELLAKEQLLRIEAESGAKVRALEIERLKLMLAKARRETFGQSSERGKQLIEQLELAIEDLEETKAATETKAAIAAPDATRERRARAPRKLPENLPVERIVEHPPCACGKCGTPRLRKLGEVVIKTLECEPRRWKIIEHVREKFSCRDCDSVTEPPAPSHPIPRGFAGPSLLAWCSSRSS